MGRPPKTQAAAPPPKTSQTAVWRANPGPQRALFQCPADIILFGGAAGGGKTDSMIIDAVRGTVHDGYRGIIFRRTFPELEKHIIERSHVLFSGLGRYNDKKHCWTFPAGNGGKSLLYFGYLEQDKDVFAYHGGEFQFIGFDESTMFSEFQVRFMLTRLRSTIKGIRRRMLLSSNPIGPGFGFHKLMFVERVNAQGEAEKLIPGKIYRDATWPSDGRPVLKTTCFIPATVYDNPILLKADPGYIDNINSQSGPLAKALLTGSWNEAISVAVVFDKKIHTVSPDADQGEAKKPAFVNPQLPPTPSTALKMWQIPPTAPRWIGLDWGKTDKACAVWQTSFDGRIYWYRDHTRPGKIIRSYAEEVVARSVGETIAFVVLSHECFAEHGENHTQADQFIEVFSKAGIPVIKSGRDPEGRLMLLREFLRVTKATTMEGAGALDDYAYWQKEIEKRGDRAWKEYSRLKMLASESDKLPRLQIFTSGGPGLNFGCPYIIKTLPLLTVDIEKPKQLAKGQDDHGFDAGTTGLKFYLQHDEAALIEAYQKQLGGVMPESGFQAEMAMKSALEAAENGEGEEMAPFQMETEKFDDGSGGRGGPF